MKEETLYDKMHEAITCDVEDEFNATIEQAIACERVAIQAQIDLLGNQNEKLGKQKNELLTLLQDANGTLSIHRLSGKIEGVRLAIENNRQEIQELEKQLS